MRTSLKLRLGKAFTLIELLIVITIIGILAVALIPRISQGPARARDVSRKADLQNVANALELFYADNNAYPGVVGTPECLSSTSTAGLALVSYLQGGVMPDDSGGDPSPCTTTTGGYSYNPVSATSFILAADLEINTATGDGIYCTFPTTTPLSATSLCTSTTPTPDAYYVIAQ